MELLFRAATNDDRLPVIALVRACLDEFQLPYDETRYDVDLVDIARGYDSIGGVLLIVEDACQNLVGTVGIVPVSGGGFYLRKMYVGPGHRGRGVGRQLLTRALGEARSRGATFVTLNTMTAMTAARALYESFGFRETGPVEASPRVEHLYRLEMQILTPAINE